MTVVLSDLDEEIERYNRQLRELSKNVEHWKGQERDHHEKINDDAKELERMTNKQSLLLKKVPFHPASSVFTGH